MKPLLATVLLCGLITSGSLLLVYCGREQDVGAQPYSAALEALASAYMEDFFQRNPSAGTRAGLHQYDSLLEDYSQASIEAWISSLRGFEKRFRDLDPAGMSELAAADREMLISHVRAWLLELEVTRTWEKNPDFYSSAVSNSTFLLMSRNFAPPAERLKSLSARQRKMAEVFQAARANLKNPPRIFTDIAIQQLPGIIDFFKKDVPLAFQSVRDAGLLSEFQQSNQQVIGELEAYEKFLRRQLLPVSQGDFRLGAETYRKKLLYEEMIDIPLERLLEIGYADLRRNQQRFKEVAAAIDPNRSAEQILHELEKDHPAPDALLQTFRDVLGGLKRYIETKHIITIPPAGPPIVQETPPFMRALTFASMEYPGPFEEKATEAFFNLTLPEKGWTRQQLEEHMAGFNRGRLISTAIHEAYPGHYVQYLWGKQAPSNVRRFLSLDLSSTGVGAFAYSNVEGWAHYTEQMMLDEGYGDGDPRLRLGQLQDALLRDARFVVGIEMHTGKITFEQGVDFFVREGYQPRAIALRETARGTSDPTYLVYTAGKLQILQLREDYRKLQGSRFSLQEFHNTLMKQGVAPLKIIRRAMLGNDSPTW